MADQLRLSLDDICEILGVSDTTLVSLAISLYSKGIISSDIKQSVIRKKGKIAADELMTACYYFVRNNPSKLRMVLNCMEKENLLEDKAKSIRAAKKHSVVPIANHIIPNEEPMNLDDRDGSISNLIEKDAALLQDDEQVNFVDKDDSIEAGGESANQKRENYGDQTNNNGSTIIITEEPSCRLKVSENIIPEVQPGEEEKEKWENLQKFRQKVKIIVQTVNDNERYAVLEYMEPPEIECGKPLTNKPIDLYERNWITLGMFGGYECAVIQTEMGADCHCEVEEALEEFPQAKLLLAIGVAFACDSKKFKLGDVLVSKVIDGVGNVKHTKDGLKIFRASLTRLHHVSQKLKNVFARELKSWSNEKGFICNKAGRQSEVHPGVIISSPELIDNQEVKDKNSSNTPEAIGGEMEGVILVEIQQSQAKRKRSTPPRDIDVIVIKGVADFADGKKLLGKKWQYTAARAAADYVNYKLTDTKKRLFIERTSFHT